jgi:methyl-accepting chemotaxis protein
MMVVQQRRAPAQTRGSRRFSVADSSKARRLNVLQRMTLGYWALVLPIVVAAVLVVMTVALVKVRYVAREGRLLAVNHASVDLRYDLIRQEDRLGVFKASGVSKSLNVTILQQAQAQLAAEVKHLDSAIAASGSLPGYDAFKTAWANFDSAVAGGLALAGQARPGFEGKQIPPNAVTTAAKAINAVAVVYDAGEEQYSQTDRQMWKFVYSTTGVALVILVIAALAGTFAAVSLPRRVAKQLRSLIGALGATTAQMLGVVSQVASAAVQTASAISEAATTVDEVRQTSLVASQKATEVAEDAQRADQVVEVGRQAVTKTLEGMGRIQHEMTVVTESVMRMSEQSESVSEIMSTVNSMAEQSSLLSVNAAIEASSAGEYGKGFAVVADEIRNLAVGSKHSVGQVRNIMTDVEKATSAAVMAAEQSSHAVDQGVEQAQVSSTAIDQLAESVSTAAQSAAQIVTSAHQQLVGMDQIAAAMSSIDEAGTQNARGAQELESSVGHVETMAADLADMVASINPLAALRRRRAASPAPDSDGAHKAVFDRASAPGSTANAGELPSK